MVDRKWLTMMMMGFKCLIKAKEYIVFNLFVVLEILKVFNQMFMNVFKLTIIFNKK